MKADGPVDGGGVGAMKMEEINQWYHLHGSLAKHRPQRFSQPMRGLLL